MKKIYMTPRSRYVALDTESLIANSFKVDNSDGNAITGGDGDDAWTQHQQSIWDYWKDEE